MAVEAVITVYGRIMTPEDIEQERIDKINGVVRYHKTTYLEYEIPEEIEDELSEMVEKRLKQFRKVCKCEDCKKSRKKLKSIVSG